MILTDMEIENKQDELIRIVNMNNSTAGERLKKLRDLALEVGASHMSTEGKKTANEGELVVGIQAALQTSAMLNTCKAARKAWIVALIAALASVVSAGAAWTAILK